MQPSWVNLGFVGLGAGQYRRGGEGRSSRTRRQYGRGSGGGAEVLVFMVLIIELTLRGRQVDDGP